MLAQALTIVLGLATKLMQWDDVHLLEMLLLARGESLERIIECDLRRVNIEKAAGPDGI